LKNGELQTLNNKYLSSIKENEAATTEMAGKMKYLSNCQ
jgi:hypothetical protein